MQKSKPTCLWWMFGIKIRPGICIVFFLHTIFVSFRSVWSGVTYSKPLSWWDESQLHGNEVQPLSASEWSYAPLKNLLHRCHGNRLGLLSKPHLGDWDVPRSGEVQYHLHMYSINTCTQNEHSIVRLNWCICLPNYQPLSLLNVICYLVRGRLFANGHTYTYIGYWFLKVYFLRRNQRGWCWEPQTVWGTH